MSCFVKRNRILAVLLIAGLLQVTIEIASDGFTAFPDTEGYIETVKWYQDGSGDLHVLRIQRPLQILIVLAFEPLLGITNAFILTNSIFYLSAIPFFHSFSRKLLGQERLAAYSTFMFMTSFCVLHFGLALLTDMLVWFLFCVGLDMLVDIRGEWNRRKVYALAVIAGLGMLNKETFAAIGLLLIIVYLSHHVRYVHRRLRKVAEIALPLAVMAAPFLLVQCLIFDYFGPGYSFFDYHQVHTVDDVRDSPLYLVATFVMAFNVILILYSVGLRRFLNETPVLTKREYVIWLVVLLIPVVIFEYYEPRLSFIVFAMVIPPSVLGVETIAKRLSINNSDRLVCAFLIVYAAISNIVSMLGDEVRELLGIWPRLAAMFL